MIDGDLAAIGVRIALVGGRWNSVVVDRLIAGALDTIVRHGGKKDDVLLVNVPGSYEIPVAVRKLAKSGRYDAVIALGAIIKGETSHDIHITNTITSGLTASMQETGVPITFGIITANNMEQAIDRSGGKMGNKGSEAALAAIEIVSVLRKISMLTDSSQQGVHSHY